MARIDFAFGAADRLRMTCEVVRKHYASGRPLVIYTQNAPLLARFDRLLWGFEATAFIPHVDVNDPLAAQTSVLLTSASPVPPAVPADIQAGADSTGAAIAASGKPALKSPWLINLDTQCPPNANLFERVLEIVSNDPDDVLAARQRWRQYKADGHTVQAHAVS